ncbi:alkaline shock response membrane anchor protein AmaP [Actinomadura hibisca]|uniref:alkaline shock response membrane anchor protein AmaP n=1 Tax=Actinomadura hibisca TaxID=68565 RepID=UPI00082BBC7C|nr:alkaline shock response membrane anchor protein AmaP [Actinomadura hibisca]
MDRRATKINHTGLLLFGLALLAAGAFGLARGLNAWGQARAGEPLLAAETRRFAAEQSWFWPALAAAAIVLALLGVAWLLAQGRSDKLPGIFLDGNDTEGHTRVQGKAVTDALEAEIEDYPGVKSAKARLSGKTDQPKLRLNVAYDHRADLDSLRRNISGQAVARLSTALGQETLPAVVRLRLVPGPKQERTVA